MPFLLPVVLSRKQHSQQYDDERSGTTHRCRERKGRALGWPTVDSEASGDVGWPLWIAVPVRYPHEPKVRTSAVSKESTVSVFRCAASRSQCSFVGAGHSETLSRLHRDN